MDGLFIKDRPALDDAAELMHSFGKLAEREAAARARDSRNGGNLMRFCHWRQVERVIATLSSSEVLDTIH